MLDRVAIEINWKKDKWLVVLAIMTFLFTRTSFLNRFGYLKLRRHLRKHGMAYKKTRMPDGSIVLDVDVRDQCPRTLAEVAGE